MVFVLATILLVACLPGTEISTGPIVAIETAVPVVNEPTAVPTTKEPAVTATPTVEDPTATPESEALTATLPGTVWESQVPATQDYQINVRSRFGDDYSLKVTLDPPPEPVVINQGHPPANICLVVHPGGVAPAVNIYDGPGEQFTLIARLGNWAEVVKSTGDWHMIFIEPGKPGWVAASSVKAVGDTSSLPILSEIS